MVSPYLFSLCNSCICLIFFQKRRMLSRSQRMYSESQKACSMPRRQPAFPSAVIHDSLACPSLLLSDIDIHCGISASVALGKKRLLMAEVEDFRKCMSVLLAKLSAPVDNRVFSLMQPQSFCVMLS